jgi:hypothetical protein
MVLLDQGDGLEATVRLMNNVPGSEGPFEMVSNLRIVFDDE